MEGDVIVMQDVFVFEQTGVVEGKIQGRLKPTGIRPKFVEKFEVMGINLPPGLFGFTLLGQEGAPTVDPMTLVVAGVAALAILLIAVGIATSGAARASPTASSATPPAKPTAKAAAQPARAAVGDLIASERRRSTSLNKVVEQRDFGANLAREHRPRRPQAQAVRVPRRSGRARSSACRSLMFVLSLVLPALGNPIVLLDRRARRLPAAALLARAAARAAASTRSTSSCRTRSP